MTSQMIIRVDPGLKERVSRLAKKEGKTLSELVRELLEKYTKDRDMGAYIDDLWDRIGKRLVENNVTTSEIERAIRESRSK